MASKAKLKVRMARLKQQYASGKYKKKVKTVTPVKAARYDDIYHEGIVAFANDAAK